MPKSVHRAVVYPVRRSARLRPGKTLNVSPSLAPAHSI
ncbi:PIN domain-containing protein, partial [bacterium]|nr:PIN domain-containing protein [bacterium]